MDLEIEADLQANTIIHIGFAKCASTTLQNLFAMHESLTYIDQRYTGDLLLAQHPLLWDGRRAHSAFSQLLAEARDFGITPVISDERLVGNEDMVDIAHRLHALMPRARILICLREQFSMLASLYKHYVRSHGCTLDVNEYTRHPSTFWEAYQYGPIIKLYQSLFGKERVHITLMEELRDGPEAFYADIYRFLGVAPCPYIDIQKVHHEGISDLEAAQFRLRNFVNADPNNLSVPNPFQGLPINELLINEVERMCAEMKAESVPSIKTEVRTAFKGRFAAGNRELSALIGKDLAAFGYEVAPGASLPAADEIKERFALQPVRLLSHSPYRGYTIVHYRDLLFAVSWHCELEGPGRGHRDLAQMSREERDGFLQDRDLDTLKRKIDAKENAALIIVSDYHGYAIVDCRQRHYAIPLTTGVLDIALLQAMVDGIGPDNPDCLACDSVAECQACIDAAAALIELEQQLSYQSLQGSLSELLQQGEMESSLFGLPAAETWAYFRLLWSGLCASRQADHGTASVTPSLSLPPETLLNYAQQSSAMHSYSFSACANFIQMQLLHDASARLQIAVSQAQLQTTQGQWEAAETLVRQNLEQNETPGGYAVLLSYQAALRWVRRLFSALALETRTAQKAFVLLRDLNICFLHCAVTQQALVSILPQNDAPSLAAAYTRLGEALLSLGLLVEAEPAFCIASELTPENAMIHNDLAVVYWQMAEQTEQPDYIQQALAHIEDALRLDPLNAEILVNAEVILSAQRI